MANRPFITCHVLDTITGKPAAGIAVTLKALNDTERLSWTATTNKDGRVTAWSSESDTELNTIVESIKRSGLAQDMVWSLTFDTESYFGKGNTFWPEVELRFNAKKEEEHYHVPLLLGPWSYTTYRGS